MDQLLASRGIVLHQHIAWVTNPDPHVRFCSLVVLSRHALQTDATLLQAALHDPDPINARWAMRGLIQLWPPDIETVLRQWTSSRDSEMNREAVFELARRGDAIAMHRLLAWLESLPNTGHDKEGWGAYEVQAACRVLVERGDPRFIPALESASSSRYRVVQCPVSGALASYGSREALDRLRRFAREGGARDRATAIEWLGVVKDRDSLPFLRQKLDDPEPWIRDAAREALRRIDPHFASHNATGGSVSN
jgi:hypothetical protein